MFFLQLFLLFIFKFESHLANTMSQFNDIYFHQYICMLALNHFIVLKFFYLSRFKN